MFLWSGNGEDAFYALAGGVMRRAGPNGAPMRNAKAPFFHLPVGSSARLGQRQRGTPSRQNKSAPAGHLQLPIASCENQPSSNVQSISSLATADRRPCY